MQSECRPCRYRFEKPKRFWIYQLDGPNRYVSNMPNYKNRGFLRRIKAKANCIRKRKSMVCYAPFILKALTTEVITPADFKAKYSTVMISNKFYSTISTPKSLIKPIIKKCFS